MGRQTDRDGEYYKVQDTCKEFDLYLFVSLVSPSFVFTFLHSNRVDLNHVETGIQGSLVSLEDAAARWVRVSGSLLLLLRCVDHFLVQCYLRVYLS